MSLSKYMKHSSESFLGEELIPMGPCDISVGWKVIWEPLRSISENAVSTETDFR